MSLGRKERDVKSTRTYSSPLRTAQAQETRRRVMSAARELFLEQGYPATTVAAVARRADVSADTIYSGFGTKAALLKAVLDLAVGGDDQDVAVLERSDPQAMRAEHDQRRQLAMFAAGMSAQLERIRPLDDVLRSAAAVDPAAAELRDDLQLRQRRAAMRTIVSWIASNGPLRELLTEDDAVAMVWTLTSPEVHGMLRAASGWTPERYEQWLRETLTSSLLP
ncbi:MAG: hypothetical protein QOJ68_2594 [Blastococcus sp.]|nr:hypothetical protein [Blastococcus sp.]